MGYRMLGSVTEAENAVMISDGGAKRSAAFRPLIRPRTSSPS